MFDIRRITTDAELMRASSLLDLSGVYGIVPVAQLQGTTMYGMFADDGMFGCAMAVVQGSHAYIDYLCIHKLMQNEGHGTSLVEYMRKDLYCNHGVRTVHACVQGDNGASLRVCSKLEPLIGFPFTKLTFKLEDNEDG